MGQKVGFTACYLQLVSFFLFASSCLIVITKNWVTENEKQNIQYTSLQIVKVQGLLATHVGAQRCAHLLKLAHSHTPAHKLPHRQAHSNSLYFSNPFFPRSTTVQLHSNPCIICWMNKDFFYVVIWIKPILRCINDLFFKFLLSVLSTYMTSTVLKNIST